MASRSTRRRVGGSAIWLTAPILAAALAGCSGPIETYRSFAGFSRNDPDPATAPFTENLASAENGSYPNLGSVPDAPIVSTTAAEREKVAQQLNAQRVSTQANDKSGSPGAPTPGPVPPPPAIPPALAAAVPTSPPPAPETPPPMRGANEPPAAQPLNSTLETPQPSSPPPGIEAARAAPQQAALAPIPPPAPSALPPEQARSGNPEPAPAVPVLPEPKPSPQAAAMPPPKPPPTPALLASLDVPPGSAELSPAIEAQLGDVVTRYKQNPGIVRVVAYTTPGVGGAEQLNAYRTALDRAHLVAKALGDAGIPQKQIQTESAPSTASAPVGRVDVQLLPPGPTPAPPGGKA
jgi:outer membrane protein OmpA-like peptidoglycan-associated protein